MKLSAEGAEARFSGTPAIRGEICYFPGWVTSSRSRWLGPS
jgi:hypothetical protein